MSRSAPLLLLSLILFALAEDNFKFPLKFGVAGEYIFTVGQQITFMWDSANADDQLSLFLVRDVDAGLRDCEFQSSAKCWRIAGMLRYRRYRSLVLETFYRKKYMNIGKKH